MTLSESDMNHAIRFVVYATMHIGYHVKDSRVLFEHLFPNCCLSIELASTLLKLLSLPCDALKRAFIAFYDALHHHSSPSFIVSEGTTGFMSVERQTPYSDMAFQSIMYFLFRRPSEITPFPTNEGTFDIQVGSIRGSHPCHLPIRSLWTLFTPTQPHHTNFVITAFREFSKIVHSTCRNAVWIDWLTSFFKVVQPATLPFTILERNTDELPRSLGLL
ncbi:hypothetical protein BLNAU_11248 [Blattamonas nauphoetae]|uniref:Uncharacterized protein n=1 Tax=Blattamonas nauphoetae TaxID=2049346 RepID=A0ABQ9XSS2_9EUKA|nr:hypothetical protein BLNAU_11248 [Blattamonas nauphoetae]